MDKAEQPTTQARYTVADYELAEQCASAANVVTCDGYYEVDIEKVAETLAKARTTSLAAQDGLVEALRDALAAAYVAGATDVHNAWVEGVNGGEPDFGEAGWDYAHSIALSAIKEQPHD